MSKYFLFVFLLIGQVSVSAQTEVEERTQNQIEFNENVNKWLSFSVPFISVNKLETEQEEYIILDSREEEEYEVGHIAGAQCVGYDDFDVNRLKGISKDAKIAVYCSIGYRSEKVTEKLIKAGYVNAVNVYGSIFQWVNDGKPIYNSNGEETNKVHTFNRKWSKWVITENVEKTW